MWNNCNEWHFHCLYFGGFHFVVDCENCFTLLGQFFFVWRTLSCKVQSRQDSDISRGIMTPKLTPTSQSWLSQDSTWSVRTRAIRIMWTNNGSLYPPGKHGAQWYLLSQSALHSCSVSKRFADVFPDSVWHIYIHTHI